MPLDRGIFFLYFMNVSFFYFYNKEKSKHLDRWKDGWVNGWAGGWVDGKIFGEW